MIKRFKNYFIYTLLCFIIPSGCEEAAIPIDDNISTTPLTIDTVSFPVINTISYQVPPDIGLHEYLYFGKKDEFSFLYNLIRFSSIDSTNLYTFDYYKKVVRLVKSLDE